MPNDYGYSAAQAAYDRQEGPDPFIKEREDYMDEDNQ